MLSRDEMMTAFRPHRTPYRPLVGFEYEIQCFRDDPPRPLRFAGPGNLAEILDAAARLAGGELAGDPGDPPTKVQLPDQGLLSLEPGGQLEFSSSPQESFAAAMQQLDNYLQLLDELRSRFKLHCFYGGASPVHTPQSIGLVAPTRRYAIMDRYFSRVGTMGQRMMRQTCSIQVSFDYRDADDGADLLRTAQLVAPIAAALFANSPYLDGCRTPYLSNRVPIWANTDPSRTGVLPGIGRPDYSFEDYLDQVLRVPMFFVRTADGLHDVHGQTFAARLARPEREERALDMSDFLLHNSTIFTDVRLKHTVEVRTVDSQDPALVPAAVAFLSGILHCRRSRAWVQEVLEGLGEDELRLVTDRLSRTGLTTAIAGRPVCELAGDLIELAAQGLPTCFPDGAQAVQHLEPLRELVHRGQTPADVVLRRHGDDAGAWLAAGRTFA